jgi:hypothetical protein
MAMNFAYEISFFIPVGFLNMPYILQHGIDGFISPPKEVFLRNFVALKNHSSSAGFESANLVSNDKHANH